MKQGPVRCGGVPLLFNISAMSRFIPRFDRLVTQIATILLIPRPHGGENRLQSLTGFGQVVLDMQRYARVERAGDNSFLLQQPQPVCQRLRTNRMQPAAQFPEALGSVKQWQTFFPMNETEVLEDASHYVQEDRPDRVAASIRRLSERV